MKWVNAKEVKPIPGVQVHVITESGIKSVAKYWSTTGKWLSTDNRLHKYSVVVKWKYEEATI